MTAMAFTLFLRCVFPRIIRLHIVCPSADSPAGDAVYQWNGKLVTQKRLGEKRHEKHHHDS